MFERLSQITGGLIKYKSLISTETVKLAVCDVGTLECPTVPIFRTEYLFRGCQLKDITESVRFYTITEFRCIMYGKGRNRL